MTKLIIGTISDMDTPMTASSKGAFALNAWFYGITEKDLQKSRDEVLDCEPSDIRALADPMEAVLEDAAVCIIGSETVISRDRDAVKTVRSFNDFE